MNLEYDNNHVDIMSERHTENSSESETRHDVEKT